LDLLYPAVLIRHHRIEELRLLDREQQNDSSSSGSAVRPFSGNQIVSGKPIATVSLGATTGAA
jgi:hypothetical protein